MIEGLLWYDNDGDQADRIRRAAARYAEKFGHEANTCYVHPDGKAGTVDGIRVIPSGSTLANHYWVGVEDD